SVSTRSVVPRSASSMSPTLPAIADRSCPLGVPGLLQTSLILTNGATRMSRHIQVTFDAHDPQGLSSFWRDVLGYEFPAPPGAELPEGGDPLAAWEEFLERAGVPKEERNTRTAIADPDGKGTRAFLQ